MKIRGPSLLQIDHSALAIPRCNEDLDCRNSRGLRVANNLKKFFSSKMRDINSKIEEENHQCSLPSLYQREGALEMQSIHVIDDLEPMTIIDSMPNKQCKHDPIPMFYSRNDRQKCFP